MWHSSSRTVGEQIGLPRERFVFRHPLLIIWASISEKKRCKIVKVPQKSGMQAKINEIFYMEQTRKPKMYRENSQFNLLLISVIMPFKYI